MVLNPDVVVRSRGVMEKCTLCIQRIQAGKVAARQSGNAIADGQIQTACQQACPAKAIVFGDMQDPGSQAARFRQSPRHYHLLADLGTRPGVGYLTNSEPEAGRGDAQHGERSPAAGSRGQYANLWKGPALRQIQRRHRTLPLSARPSAELVSCSRWCR
jgi:molybdopterin-containing oxidoreductase family iron-sulfur binding subunit